MNEMIIKLIDSEDSESDKFNTIEHCLRLYNSIISMNCQEIHNKNYFNEDILNKIIVKPLKSTNKYIRQSAYIIVESLCLDLDIDTLLSPLYCNVIISSLSNGLSDEFTQVRYSASFATRAFYVKVGKRGEEFYPLLLPKICFNRYHPAEGIRIYTQETWKLIVGMNGRLLISKYIDEVIKYYLIQLKSFNPAIQETSCLCVNELYSKIEATLLTKYIPQIIELLIQSCKQISWRVRGNASV